MWDEQDKSRPIGRPAYGATSMTLSRIAFAASLVARSGSAVRREQIEPKHRSQAVQSRDRDRTLVVADNHRAKVIAWNQFQPRYAKRTVNIKKIRRAVCKAVREKARADAEKIRPAAA